jgi:catechol 2,3-dioxygenase-like lactoylglutathione lyase family enzyme
VGLRDQLRKEGDEVTENGVGALRAHHTGMTVMSIDRSLEFYRDVLGFELVVIQEGIGEHVAKVFGYPGAHTRIAKLRAPGSDHLIELVEWITPEGRPTASGRPEPYFYGSSHVCYAVDDLQALYERLVAADVEFFNDPGGPVEVLRGINAGARALYIRDPDGIPVELIQPVKKAD